MSRLEDIASKELEQIIDELRGGASTGDPLTDWLLLHYRKKFFEPETEEYYRRLAKEISDHHLEMVLVSRKSELCLKPNWPQERSHRERVEIGLLEGLSLDLKPPASSDNLLVENVLRERSVVIAELPTRVHVRWELPEKPQMIEANIVLAEIKGLDTWDPSQDTREELQTNPLHGKGKGPHWKMEVVCGNEQVRTWCAKHEFGSQLEEAITFLS